MYHPYGRLLVNRESPRKIVNNIKEARPSAVHWDQHKDEIKRLYVEDGRRLEDVMEHMERHYGFKAT